MRSRLTEAFNSGIINVPKTGDIIVFNPVLDCDLTFFPKDRTVLVQRDYNSHKALFQRGFTVCTDVERAEFSSAFIFIDKSKAETRRLLASAMACVETGHPVIVNGDKNLGIESILKLCRQYFSISDIFSKGHGKIFILKAKAAPAEWHATPYDVSGYVTYPGVFGSEQVDPGSTLLVQLMPDIHGDLCDLGAGWGYLSAEALKKNPDISKVDLVESDWFACKAARQNIRDTRACVHWADARTWAGAYDWVISNPPFHNARNADLTLGQTFIQSAARLLKPKGKFFMVANRHLPYEATLKMAFGVHKILYSGAGFKVFCAEKPRKV